MHEKWGNEWGLSENNGDPTFENWQKEAGIYHGRFDTYIDRFFAEMKAAGKDVQLAFNEWGIEIPTTTGCFPVALVTSDYLISLFRHPVYSACDWNLNMGPTKSRILSTTNGGHDLQDFNPSAQIFTLCAPALEKQSLPMTSSDPLVYGFAAKDSTTGKVQVFLLNKHSESATVDLTIQGTASAISPCETASFVEPGILKTDRFEMSDSKKGRITLAPLSFSRIGIETTESVKETSPSTNPP